MCVFMKERSMLKHNKKCINLLKAAIANTSQCDVADNIRGSYMRKVASTSWYLQLVLEQTAISKDLFLYNVNKQGV